MAGGLGWGHNTFLIRSGVISLRSLATQDGGVFFFFFSYTCLEGNIEVALQKCVWGMHTCMDANKMLAKCGHYCCRKGDHFRGSRVAFCLHSEINCPRRLMLTKQET